MRIEEITKSRLGKATDLELKQLKYKMSKLWDNNFKSNNINTVGCFTRGGFIGKYRLLLKELDSSKRNLQHSTCDIDRKAFAQSMQVKKDGFDIAMLEDVVMQKCYIFINEDFIKTEEVAVTVCAAEPIEIIKILLEQQVAKSIKELIGKSCVFTYDDDYQGECVPLFSQTLHPVAKIEKATLKKKDGKEGEQFDEPIELVPVAKGDEHIVYGIVYEPNTEDAQGDQANAEEIKKAAYDFMEHCQDFKVMHKGKKVKIRILENYIAPVAFSIGKRKVKKGSWVLVTRVLDKKVWEDIKSGKLTGYSMAGYAKIV